MKHVFIINPAAGKADTTTEVAANIRAVCLERALDYDILTTEYPRHAVELVKKKAVEYAGEEIRFYACGGDGTLNEVAAGAAGLHGVSVTHYPCGSGNDFIKLFGADCTSFKKLENLIDGKDVALDYIESDCGVCFNVFSVGVDARIASGMQKYKRIPLLHGTMAYHASTVEHVLRGLHEPYGIEIDGVDYSGRRTLILAGNGRFYGGGYNPVPEADPTDGLLDVLVIDAVDLLTVMKVIGAYKAGKHRQYPQYIKHLRAKEMTVWHRDGKDMTVNLDGEIVLAPRVSLRVAEHKIRFTIPRCEELLPPRIVE
ncbi:MAG: lipid kinase [Clostridia bacterium]|nr:lipid kinase [Clostridia bacterium]